MSNPAPGFASHPNHSVTIKPHAGAVIVSIDGVEITRSGDTLMLEEANYPVAFYLPKNSLPDAILSDSDHTTYCPFKGHASYYHLVHNGKTHENAIWSYREPYDEALAIKDYVAIYPNVAKTMPAS